MMKIGRLGARLELTPKTEPLLPHLKFQPPYDEWLVKRNIMPKPEEINLYKLLRQGDKMMIFIPIFLVNDVGRLYGLEEKIIPELDYMLPYSHIQLPGEITPSWVNIVDDYPLLTPSVIDEKGFYDYQREAAALIKEKFFNADRASRHMGSCVLNMMTGAGKTYIAVLLTHLLGQRTLYITHRRRIAAQTKDVYASYGFNNEADVRVMVVNSLIGMDPAERAVIFKNYSFIVYDEVHRYCSKQFSEVFWITRSKYNLCLSATTDEREDGCDILYHIHHGPTVFADTLGVKSKIYHFDVEVTLIKRNWPKEYLDVEKSKNGTRSYLRASGLLNTCDARNTLILQAVMYMLQNKHCVYVLTYRRDMVDKLYEMINGMILAAPQYVSWATDDNREVLKMMGEMTDEEYARAHESGLVIVATYSYVREGISIPHMTAEIFADPPLTSTLKQCLGRILRPGPQQTKKREIIDLVDMKSMFEKWAQDRYKIYYDRGWRILSSLAE
jgi:superfamily II DNA or RNA helicase